jgi:arylsulfatase A-like enzyme
MRAIVLTADGLGAHWLGAYGNDWVATPQLDRLAAAGVVFDWHYADVPDPAATRQVWRTGRHPFPPSAAGAADLFAGLPGHRVSVWQADLAAAADLRGVFTAAADALLWAEASLLPPWDLSDERLAPYFEEFEGEEGGPEPMLDPPPGELTDDRAFDGLQRTFAAAVTAFDDACGRLLGALDPDGQALVIVTAGRGQMLGEHGTVGDFGPQLHEARTHLPLIVRLPGAANAGHRVGALTQSMDLLPTLLDAFGVPVPADAHGRSLLPLARSGAEPGRPYLCLGLAADAGREWAIRTPEWYFCWRDVAGEEPAPEGQLFRKPDDRWEVNDLRQQHLEWADHLKETARRYVEAARQPGPLAAPALDFTAEGAEGAEERQN